MGAVRTITVSQAGDLSLPQDVRRLLGVENGGAVTVRIDGGELRIRAVNDVMADLKDDAEKILKGDSVGAFLAERRREAEAEFGNG